MNLLSWFTEWTRNRFNQIKSEAPKEPVISAWRAAQNTRNAEWRRLYEDEGLTTTEIGARFGTHNTTVRRVLIRMGVLLRSKGPRPDRGHPGVKRIEDTARITEMVRLRTEEHWGLREIGERFGITRERVRQLLAKAGVDMRAAARERSRAVSKDRRLRPKYCKVCGENYGWGNWKAHFAATRHAPQRNDELDRALAEDYAAGIPLKAIKARHGKDASAVMRAVKRLGVSRRRPGVKRPSRAEATRRKDRIAAEYAIGADTHEIAARHGVSTAWVYMIARERGLRRRKAS